VFCNDGHAVSNSEESSFVVSGDDSEDPTSMNVESNRRTIETDMYI
jgi:hypothetical protein